MISLSLDTWLNFNNDLSTVPRNWLIQSKLWHQILVGRKLLCCCFVTDKALLATSIDWHSWHDENTCDCFSCCFSFAINLDSIEHDFSEEEAIFTKSPKPPKKCPPPKSRHSTRSRRGQCWKLINSSSDFNPLKMSLSLKNRILLSDRIAVVMLKVSCGVNGDHHNYRISSGGRPIRTSERRWWRCEELHWESKIHESNWPTILIDRIFFIL